MLTVSLAFGLLSCAAPAAQVPQPIFKKEKIGGDEPHLAATYRGKGCGDSVHGAYKLCISQEGRIRSVDIVESIPDADGRIVETLRGWRYKPVAIPICFVQNLQFKIECGAGAGAAEAAAADGRLDSAKAGPLPGDAPDAAKLEWEGVAPGDGQAVVVLAKDDDTLFTPAQGEQPASVERVRFHRQRLWRTPLPSQLTTAAALVAAAPGTLYVVQYPPIASGATLHALDLETGQLRYSRPLRGLGPISHSKYWNRVALKLVSGFPVVFGSEAAGRYIEVLDPATGRTLSNRVLAAGP